MNNKAIFGIDPGKEGAISVIFPDDNMVYFVFPKIGEEIDVVGTVNVIKTLKRTANASGYLVQAFVEDVHAIAGASAASTFNFGGAVKTIHTALAAFEIPMILVKPKEWQNSCWRGVKPQTKLIDGKHKVDTKSTSLMAASRLMPKYDFIAPNTKSRKPHDGIVDACLIAWFGKNFHFNKP